MPASLLGANDIAPGMRLHTNDGQDSQTHLEAVFALCAFQARTQQQTHIDYSQRLFWLTEAYTKPEGYILGLRRRGT